MAQEMTLQLGQLMPAWEMLAEQIGVSVPEAMDMASRGLIDADTGITALLAAMGERYGGLMEAQMDTLLGKWGNFKDQLIDIARTTAKPIVDSLGDALDSVAESLGDMTTEEIEATLEPEVMNRYRPISQTRERAVTPVLNGVCYGCFMAMPTATVRTNDELRWCQNCGSFVYYVD